MEKIGFQIILMNGISIVASNANKLEFVFSLKFLKLIFLDVLSVFIYRL